MNLLTMAYRNIFRNKRRSLLSGFAILIATMSIVLLYGYIDGMKADMKKNLVDFYLGNIRIRNAQYTAYEHMNPLMLGIPYSTSVNILTGIEGIETIAPRIKLPAGFIRDTETGLLVQAVDFEAEKQFQNIDLYLKEGRLPESADAREIVLTKWLLKKLNVTLNEKITLLIQTKTGGTNAMTFRICGVVEYPVAMLNSSTAYIPIRVGQHFARMDDLVTEILIKTKPNTDERIVVQRIKAMQEFQNDFEIKIWKEIHEIYSFFELSQGIYAVIVVIFFILASTVIINTTLMVVFERMKEIGTLGALGMEDGQITKLFFLEALIIAFAGALLGSIAANIVGIPLAIYGIDFSGAMQGISMEISGVVKLKLSPVNTIIVFCYAIIIAACAVFLPSRQAARIKPIEALRSI